MDSRPVPPDRPIGPGPILLLVAFVVLLGGAAGVAYFFERQGAERRREMAERQMIVERELHARRVEEEQLAAPTPTRNPYEEENRLLRARIAKLERELEAAKPSPPPAAPTLAELEKEFAGLAEAGLSSFGKEDFKALGKKLKDAGREGLDLAIRLMLRSESPIERFLAAGLVEQIHDAASIPALAEAAKDKDDLTRRMAVHALAFVGDEAAAGPLKEAMLGDEDWGVRSNASYGLAKLGHDEGVGNLVKLYQAQETPVEYRMAILGGLADVAAPSTAPLFRGILRDSKEMGALLAAIGALTKMKDTGSVNDLKRLAETGSSDSVRKAAERAVQAIVK